MQVNAPLARGGHDQPASGADFGDDGVAFVALPQILPRNVNWSARGNWVHAAKADFEKYFPHKVRSGVSEPGYERVVMKRLGIERLRGGSAPGRRVE